MEPMIQAARVAPPAERGFRLLLPGVADQARVSETRRLRDLRPQLPLTETLGDDKYEAFCAAAADRRVRERQVALVAEIVVAVLATVPILWLIIRTVPAWPAELLGYVGAVAGLTLPALLALRGRRAFSTLLLAGFAATACAWGWSRVGDTPWWDPRWLLAARPGYADRLITGIALGSALTVVLIIFALLCGIALAMVIRTRAAGGPLPVRAFDHLLTVMDLLRSTAWQPGDDRRGKIDDAVRAAAVTVAVMTRGGRPYGRWKRRRHYRELRAQGQKIGRLLLDPNLLLGVREIDDEVLHRTATCLMGVCQDRLGEALRAIEDTPEPAPVPARSSEPAPATPARRVGAESRTVRRWRKTGGLVGPVLVFLALWKFGFPMPSVVIGLLASFCAPLLVVGLYLNLYPEPRAFLNLVGKTLDPRRKTPAGDKKTPVELPEQRDPPD